MTTQDLEQLRDIARLESTGLQDRDIKPQYILGFNNGFEAGFNKALELVAKQCAIYNYDVMIDTGQELLDYLDNQ